MPPPLILAPPEKLRHLAELREQRRQREAERLKTLDVFKLIGYQPHAKQQEFHAATESDVLYGGSAGGGKSAALVAEGLRACAKYPGLRVLLIRRTYDELEESIFPALRKYGMGQAVGGRWNGGTRELKFTNGALFRFRYLETIDDASRRQGGEYQLLLVDELTLMAPGVVDILRYERLRAAGDLPVLGVRASSNPGGPSHAEVKERYLEATEYGRKIAVDDHGLSVRFIPAKATDNPHLDSGYRARLDAIPDPARRAAMRDGDWDQFAGMVFSQFRHERHTLEPIPLPMGWRRFNGIDWGFAAPYAVVWAAVDEDGRVWVYREIYERQVGEAEQARRILAAEAPDEKILARYADDAMWATRGDAKPISDVYAEQGVHLTQAGKGPGSRVTGLQRIHSYMAEAPACPHHRAQGWETCPQIHFFRTCRNMLAELRALPYARTGNPEDSDGSAPDHACLVAGTLVATGRGQVPIELVAAGDRVWTRAGLRRVAAAGMTARDAVTGTVRLSDGTVLRGTANHPVWVTGHGWTRMDALRYGDILAAWQTPRSSSIRESVSDVTRTRRAGPNARTTRRVSRPGSAASSACTRRSGRTLTARSPKAARSTTMTAIPSTTTRLTWSASPRLSTASDTLSAGLSAPGLPSSWRTLARSGRSLPPGIAVNRDSPGTGSMVRKAGKAARRGLAPASGVATRMRRPPVMAMTGSVRLTASTGPGWNPAWTTRSAPASYAGLHSRSTSTSPNDSAPVYVLAGMRADSAPHDVFNLTVEGAHEFYAGGVLVHNCDALRYLLINLGGGPQFPLLGQDRVNPFEGVEALTPVGNWAVREDPAVADLFTGSDDGEAELTGRRGSTQKSPFV